MQRIPAEIFEKKLCVCGCGQMPKRLGMVHITGHIYLTKEQKAKLIEERKTPCLCGCGKMTKTYWLNGAHAKRGINGYSKRKFLTKRDPFGTCIERGIYPSAGEIIEAHKSILTELNLNPNLCWACQLYDCSQKAHIIAVSDLGENEPLNLVLLCESCHDIQHAWSFYTHNWNLEKQYEWLRMMRRWEWGNPLFILQEKRNNGITN